MSKYLVTFHEDIVVDAEDKDDAKKKAVIQLLHQNIQPVFIINYDEYENFKARLEKKRLERNLGNKDESIKAQMSLL